MRKSFDQFWMELLDDDVALNANGAEVISKDSGEEVRGGDRPYMPVIYETSTGKTNIRSTTLLENLGLNIH
ncbi:hypothetical protein FEM33_15125 [Dyadobacter flavalbus]|uniref:Uncharacterized protein n=1 Tax=Dyadobacter flavalbus TaxID=2579942 RepID=A0A5M8QUD1_9BACT|nr:hypothetical protein [Dyadobacter flavalbus]KAA6438901.1 hypothetical protein FEM33_15125 [Dyadobacter flavalbus]